MSSLSTEQREAFLQQGLYLRNWSPRTVRTYRQSIPPGLELTKAGLTAWVLSLRARGLSPGGVNLRIRSVNSLLSWLLSESLIPAPLKVRLLPVPRRTRVLLDAAAVRALVHCPHCRTRTLILLLLDTGLRISEALRLEWAHVSFDDCWLLVRGKGNHERPVPFSQPMRAVLYRWSRTSRDVRVFGLLNYRNAYRDLARLCASVGITRPVHPHLFRHQFAATYMAQGGDIYRLSRILGHASVSTTQLYLSGLGVDYVRQGHDGLTPLCRA
jgi:integrase/recombinase XerD